MYTDLLRLSIKYISSIYAARASQSSAVPQTAEEGQIVFSGGVYVGKHTSQDASVRAKASARSGLHPLEKMLAFLRSVSKKSSKSWGFTFVRGKIEAGGEKDAGTREDGSKCNRDGGNR